jgi:hypothetical protein
MQKNIIFILVSFLCLGCISVTQMRANALGGFEGNTYTVKNIGAEITFPEYYKFVPAKLNETDVALENDYYEIPELGVYYAFYNFISEKPYKKVTLLVLWGNERIDNKAALEWMSYFFEGTLSEDAIEYYKRDKLELHTAAIGVNDPKIGKRLEGAIHIHNNSYAVAEITFSGSANNNKDLQELQAIFNSITPLEAK